MNQLTRSPVIVTVIFQLTILANTVTGDDAIANVTQVSGYYSALILREYVYSVDDKDRHNPKEVLSIYRLPADATSASSENPPVKRFPLDGLSSFDGGVGPHHGNYFLRRFEGVRAFDLKSNTRTDLSIKCAEDLLLNPQHEQLLWWNRYGLGVWSIRDNEGESFVVTGRPFPVVGGSPIPRVALSPEGNRLAVALAHQDGPTDRQEGYRLSVVELASKPYKVLTVPGDFQGFRSMTGAGDFLAGPALHWLSEDQFVVVSELSRTDATLEAGRRLGRQEVECTQIVVSQDGCSSTLAFKQPLKYNDVGTVFPILWSISPQQIMFQIQNSSYRLDLTNRSLVADRRLSEHYEFRGDERFPELWQGDTLLSGRVDPGTVSISPDGREILWFIRDLESLASRAGTLQWPLQTLQWPLILESEVIYQDMLVPNNGDPTILSWHRVGQGPVVVARGHFLRNGWSGHPVPALNGPCQWLTDDTLQEIVQ